MILGMLLLSRAGFNDLVTLSDVRVNESESILLQSSSIVTGNVLPQTGDSRRRISVRVHERPS